jgi:protein-S-isoprenylcysteine O-methyltransferase Ste14
MALARPMQSLELRVPPLALVVLFAAAMGGVAYLTPGAHVPLPGRHVLALLLVAAGAGVAAAGVIAFRRHKTTVNPFTPDQSSSLVASGIYGVSRNPMYLGFLLALAGWGVYLANAVAVLGLPAFVAYMNRFQIGPEERALGQRFGPQFADYASRVRRWL